MATTRILLILLLCSLSISASAEPPLKAAFIRDQQLWIKEGDQEIQVTKGKNVYSQKWSYDGRFIGYLDQQDRKSALYIYDTKEKVNYQPYIEVETFDFQWSPTKNQLAYNDHGVLNVTKTERGRPQGFDNVALGVSEFAWFPNGREFIVSSSAVLRPTGWGPVPLYRISADANLNVEKIKPFYTLQTDEKDLFAIDVSNFKWSTDGKWISFLATPTASWAMDSNTLAVLSSQGKEFQVIGNMLRFDDWMKWAPSANQLAYISGEGRFLVENKKTTIADTPISKQQKEYTPKGYVDLDLEWFSSENVIVARAKENKKWKEGPVPTMLTTLYAINIKTDKQTQITSPRKNELDEKPQVVGSKLTWFRRNKENEQGEVWIKDGLDGQEHVWIKQADSAPVFLY
ncbi:translocation protein TolB [Bacillus sp. J14TS2]|uniref:translocation protein TolB n=1 Tax=Bacillus sp. J14TS2 TaxID=2807188 RepID=UPI001B076E2D|nr:translocation protein TolB [Bacillus sp. J14TS2]GIN72825.1 translocation protein TolB [Bacillus sp. J14TS2]